MIVVNLFAPPGAGKSTGAAYIFAQLKMKGINAELVTEFAKDKVWEENEAPFNNQAYIFGKQSYRMSRCRDKVDVIVTDSPLLLSALYNEDEVLGETFNQVVNNVFSSYNNLNFLIKRTKPYNPIGRRHSAEESDAMRQPIVDLLEKYNVTYTEATGDDDGYEQIVKTVTEYIEKNIDVGDIVKIINGKAIYGAYPEWIQKHAPDYLGVYAYGTFDVNPLYENCTYRVIAKGVHGAENGIPYSLDVFNSTVYLIQPISANVAPCYLIKSTGVEKVKTK